ncbi:putative excinuclease ABC subunit A [Mycoplasmopsis alligatoris A21JP2]|uniref:UvrABC system protein A n=1 Tax=Mycoplasmopsis alligatoris A21JP2 TaxID=747682 RepID=D4XVF5_9BACT|nr:putative excinuclease ABC subunit A [Mycoplasmopsis alligatoris A21JP2]
MGTFACSKCKGSRLNQYGLAIKIDNKNIYDLTLLSVADALITIENAQIDEQEKNISRLIIDELVNRLSFLKNVGLDYLTLSRTAESLSGGEAQRIRLATQIGSKLTGVLYILDEPSIGLHQKDNLMLIDALKQMVELGNTLVVVEHDDETIFSADHIVDIGPEAGIHGGQIVAQGSVDDICKSEQSITGKYLSKEWEIPIPRHRRSGNGKKLVIKGARENNLKNIDVTIPLGKLVGVTGVSGSGKSTLVTNIIVNELNMEDLNPYSLSFKPRKKALVDSVKGAFDIDKIIEITQSPIGRTPRSNPATYTGVFDEIRDIFAMSTESKARGYAKGRFSFNVPGGRCEKCQGDGLIKIEMHFLPDVYINCDQCDGKRYNRETLEIKYHNKSIYDILNLSVEEALEVFANKPKILTKLQTLFDVGLGYIKLGQNSTTLSGGEAQRVKLAAHLQKKPTGMTLFVLDEPTTGLHTHDVAKLIKILNRIVDNGDTVLVIEHNLDVIKSCDHLIDLGPDGGINGGRVVASGTPEQVAQKEDSYTGQFLAKLLHS